MLDVLQSPKRVPTRGNDFGAARAPRHSLWVVVQMIVYRVEDQEIGSRQTMKVNAWRNAQQRCAPRGLSSDLIADQYQSERNAEEDQRE